MNAYFRAATRGLACGLLAVVISGCGSSTENAEDTSGSLVPCDPFGGSAEPIALDSFIGAGRDQAGKIFVVDESAAAGTRVFISDNGALVRRPVSGGGGGNDQAGTWVVASVTDPVLHVKVTTAASGERKMGVLYGPYAEKDFTIGVQGEELEIVDEGVVRPMPVQNLPGSVVIEYFAEVADGRQLLVTRPDVDWSYEDFRLFFGTPERLAERSVSNVARQRDGGTTEITFTIDGANAFAYFPAPSNALPPELSIDGTKIGMTLFDGPPAATTEILCFSR